MVILRRTPSLSPRNLFLSQIPRFSEIPNSPFIKMKAPMEKGMGDLGVGFAGRADVEDMVGGWDLLAIDIGSDRTQDEL